MAKLSDDKRAAILKAATRMFSEHGYSKVTMADIADGAPVSKPTLYNYFADKEALFGAVVVDQCEALVRRISRLSSQQQGLRDQLLELARGLVELLYAESSLRLFRLVIAEQSGFPELGRMAVASGAEPVLANVANLLRTVILPPSVAIRDPDRSARMLLGLLLGDQYLRCLAGVKQGLSGRERKQLVADAVEFFLAAHATVP